MLDHATATGSHPHTKVAIIGAGFGGIAMAIRLQQHGIYDFVILEKEVILVGLGEITNIREQPVMCNHICIPCHLPQKAISRRYAEAPEIFSYIQDLVTDYNLRAFCRLNTEVLAAHYQADRCLWQLQLQDQSILEAQFVIFASGHCIFPKSHIYPVLRNFKARSFIPHNGITHMT